MRKKQGKCVTTNTVGALLQCITVTNDTIIELNQYASPTMQLIT